MKKAVIKKRTAALALSGAMSLSCLAGALAMAFTDGKKVALAAGNVVNVDASMQYQTFDGWGTSLAWWANECGDWTREHSGGKTQRDYIMELLFSEEGLNWNIARYNVGGGENPEHDHLSYDTNMPGFQYKRGGAYDWENGDGTVKNWDETADARQLWVLNAFQQIRGDIAKEKGEESDAITEFFSNSPPYWMLENQCASGRGKATNLKNDYIDDYVNYFVDVYKYLIDQGFTVDLLQPFNESSTNGEGWGVAEGGKGDQEGCAFSPEQKIKVINGVMARVNELAQKDPKYAAGYNLGDEVDTGRANNELDAISGKSGGKAVVAGADKLTYHIYGYQIDQAQQIYRRAKANGQKAEMSEITWTVSDIYDPSLMATALNKYSQSIIDIVKYGAAESYVYWQGMENLTGLIKTGWNYGLLHGVYDNPAIPSTVSGFDLASRGLVYQDVRTCKSYYVAGQYSKYVQAGYHIVEIDDDRSLAAISPEGDKLVIVKENNSANEVALNFNLGSFNANKINKIYTDASHDWATSNVEKVSGTLFKDTVSAYSVTTYVIEGESKAGSAHIIDDSAAVNKSRLSDAKKEIENNYAEKEGLFTVGSWKEDGTTQDFAGKTTYNSGGERYAAVRFYGTGVGVLAVKKSDSGVLQYWCDPTEFTSTAISENPTDEVNLKSTVELRKQQVLRVNNLEEGWHTVYFKIKAGDSSSEKFLNLDGVFVINGADDAAVTKPVVTNAFGKDKTLHVSYNGIADATGYQVEYRKVGDSDWTTESVTDRSVKITDNGFTAGNYEVRVGATKSGAADPVYSDIYTTNMSIAPVGLLYYVDCATSNFNEGGWGRAYGSCQSTFEQDYGTDPVTGVNWGVDTANTDATKGWRDEDPFSSIYYSDKKVTYKFTIPQRGSYHLTVGGFRPGDWGDTELSITIKDTGAIIAPTGKLTAKNQTASYMTIAFSTTAANKEITVQVDKPDGLSLMLITEADNPVPVLAEGKSNYTMNGSYDHSGITHNGEWYLGEELAAPDEFNIVMSDGNTEAFSMSVISSEISKMSAGEYYTVSGIMVGDGWSKKNWPAMTVYATYLLKTQKKIEGRLYYIDVGSNGKDATFIKGEKQTDDTHDQAYDGSNGWGYVNGKPNGAYNAGDGFDASIRELYNEGGYVMTGFTANQQVTLEIGMNTNGWKEREIEIYHNGTYDSGNGKITDGKKIDTVTVSGSSVQATTYSVTANGAGQLLVSFKTNTSGQNALVAYIKVCDPAGEEETVLPTLPAIKVDQTAYFRQGFTAGSEPTIALKGLEPGARVYVIDSSDRLVNSFEAPTTGTYEWAAWDKVEEDAYGLRFTQAKKEDGLTSVSGSPETVVALPRITITSDNDGKAVKVGEKVAIVVAPTLGKVPKEVFGSIDSVKITRPDNVTADLIGSFFYRTIKNGEHTITVTCNGVSYSEVFEVQGIETLTMDAEYSTKNWTDQDVTITLTPHASAGVKKMYVVKGDGEYTDENKVELTDGAYVITATENATYKVKIVTEGGSEKEYFYTVSNIDKSEKATLTIVVNYGASGGVQFNYAGSGSDGKLFVKKNGGDATVVDSLSTYTVTQAGKYEFYYVSATGKQSDTYTYYVTDDKSEVQLGAVSVGEDGTVSVTGADGAAVTAKLYRAGSKTALDLLNVANAGKYYLELTNEAGETEVVVIDTAEGSTSDNITVVQPPVTPAKNKGGSVSTDLILTIVFAVLAAAAVAGVIVIVIKRRKA